MSSTNFYSRIIAGTMTWGSWGKELSESEMVSLMHHCVNKGITTFDHADIYGDYQNENGFGKAFAKSGLDRGDIQLISKCGIQMTRGRDNKVNHYQYDAEYIIKSAEGSLRKLGTEYLDVLLLHRPSPLINPEEVAKAITQLMEQGKIKQFGVSNFTPSQIALLETCVAVEGNQVEFSLTHTSPMEDGTFDDCLIHKRMSMAWSPLGSYFRKDDDQKNRIKKKIIGLCEKYEADISQILLAFILKHPANVYPVVGTTNKERLSASLAAVDIDLELQDWFILLEASKGSQVP